MRYTTLLLTMIKIVLMVPFHSHRSVNRMLWAAAGQAAELRVLGPLKGMFPASSLRGDHASLAGPVTRKM
jgi:hypothetical protein